MHWYSVFCLLLTVCLIYAVEEESRSCPLEMCMNNCEEGYVKDENGCDTCECNPEEESLTCPLEMCMINCEQGFMKDKNGCDTCKCNPELMSLTATDPCESQTCGKGLICKVYKLSTSGHKIPKCIDPALQSNCQPPMDTGSCSDQTSRWYYKTEAVGSGVCEEFTYGGCPGNENNFLTERACKLSCVTGTEPLEGECDELNCEGTCDEGYKKDSKGCDTCACYKQCSLMTCMMECSGGFEKDEYGCDLCKCKEELCPDMSMCGISCSLGYVKDENGCKLCECSNTQPCVDGLTCEYECQFGFVYTHNGCKTCNCQASPCAQLDCPHEHQCEEMKDGEEWKANCVSLHEKKEWCMGKPMCTMYCEHGFVSKENGCPDCKCLDSLPLCTLEECTEPCQYGNRYDHNGCKTCECLGTPCKLGTCDIACEVQLIDQCPSCPATYKCLDEDSIKRVTVSLQYFYGEDDELDEEHIQQLKSLYMEQLSELIGIQKAYLQGLKVTLPSDTSAVAVEFNMISFEQDNLVYLYNNFKNKIVNHAESSTITFGDANLIPEHDTLVASYSSDPIVPEDDVHDEDGDSDDEDMTAMVIIIAAVAGAFIALLVVVIVIFAVIRSKKSKKNSSNRNPEVNYKKAPPAEQL